MISPAQERKPGVISLQEFLEIETLVMVWPEVPRILPRRGLNFAFVFSHPSEMFFYYPAKLNCSYLSLNCPGVRYWVWYWVSNLIGDHTECQTASEQKQPKRSVEQNVRIAVTSNSWHFIDQKTMKEFLEKKNHAKLDDDIPDLTV